MSEIELWTIPTNWQWATLADIGEVVSGGTPSTKNPSFWGGAINWISPADLSGYDNKFILKGAKSLTQAGLENSSAKLMPAGSIHFSSRAPIGYVVISKTNISTNQGFKSIVPAKGIFNEYVYYFLKSAKRIAEERASGTTFKELSGKAFSELPIPIPPVEEQHRIVAKVDELFSKLDQGIENLKTCRTYLNVYCQVVLKRAFEGKLTEQWHNAHADQLETAEQLLAQIKEKREQRYQQQLEEWKKAIQTWEEADKQDKKPSKPQQPTPPPPLTKQKLAELPQLASGWCWVRPEEVCSPEKYSIGIDPFGSNLKVSDYEQGGIPLIFVKNITNNDFTLDLKYISQQKFQELQAHTVQPLDIVITKMGDPPGDVAIYPKSSPVAVLTADCLKFRVWSELVDINYFKYCIESNLIKKQLGFITKGVAQKKISTERFKTLCFPLPNREEQSIIVREIEKIFSTADTLQIEITNNLKKAEILRYSILKKAFSGQLVPQDPNEESATVLLERIRPEREAVLKTTRKRVTTKKKEKTKMADLISVLESAPAWLSAQDVFTQCGISDGAETEAIEKMYLALRDLVKQKRIELERRGDEDWLRISMIKEG